MNPIETSPCIWVTRPLGIKPRWSTNLDGTYSPTYVQKNLNLIIAGANDAAVPPWIIRSVTGINDAGLIVGTALKGLPPGVSGPPDPAPHGVLLLPLQLTLLNGTTKDFDGTIPTTVIPAPENPQHDYDVTVAGGLDQLGVMPMGQGRADYPNLAYTVQTLVAAHATASISHLQYQWKRYISRRSWYIRKSTDGKSWLVTQRSTRGTGTPDEDTGTSQSYNTTLSPTKNEFYFHDTSALVYGYVPHDIDPTFTKTGDYIHEEKSFTYKVQISFDGTNWKDGASINVGQSITIRYKATGGTAVTDWQGIPNLQGGNSFTQTTVDPVITTAKVRTIVGGSLSINIDSNANN